MTEQQDRVVSLLGRAGLNGVEPDENGVFSLFVDDVLPIFLKRSIDGRDLYFYAGVASLDEDGLAQAGRAMLEGNHVELESNGFRLGVGPGTGLAFLMARQRLNHCDDDELFELFDRFVETADGWREKFANDISSSSLADDRGHDPDEGGIEPPRPSDLV